FVLTDSYGDGICCGYGDGAYTLRDSSGNIIATGDVFGSEDATEFNVSSSLGIDDDVLNQTTIFPNPSSTGIFTVRTTQLDLKFELYNMLGQNLMKGTFNNIENTIDLSNQATGMYLLKIYDGKAVLNMKLMKR
ncbi:MAG: T9SS type A sorting domain-containing protein, partial [Flavobacteriales bacterium]|nr:T9SS type A sorting domain-containing protein [Flavobacteriales bacterium]